MTDRIIWINATPPDDWGWGTENKSYKFTVKMKCKKIPKGLKGAGKPVPGGYMFYGGKRTLESKKETVGQYVGSIGKDVKTELSKFIAKKYRELYATSEEVIVEINYGNSGDSGYGESKMLREAENMKGAAASEIWFNQTNGGGTDTQGYKYMVPCQKLFDQVMATQEAVLEIWKKHPKECANGNDIETRLKNTLKYLGDYDDMLPFGFSFKEEIAEMLKNPLQVRNNLLVPDSWRTFKDNFDASDKPS